MRKLNDQGSALILVVFTMLVVFFLGFALLEVSTLDFAMANNQVDGVKAYYIAEAGMNKAIAALRYDPIVLQELKGHGVGSTTIFDTGESFGGGSFSDASITLKSDTSEAIIVELKVSGTFNKAKKELVSQARLGIGKTAGLMESDTAIICTNQFTTSGIGFGVWGSWAWGGWGLWRDYWPGGGGYDYDGDGWGGINVAGNIYANLGAYLGYNAFVDGNVFAYNDDITMYNGRIKGSLYASDNIRMDGSSTVEGNITSLDNIIITNSTFWWDDAYCNKVTGNLYASGDISLSSSSFFSGGSQKYGNSIEGNVFSSGDITLDSTKSIFGSSSGNKVTGDLFGFGSGMINLGNRSAVEGNVWGAGEIRINGPSQVIKNIQGLGKVAFNDDCEVSGSVFGAGGIDIGTSNNSPDVSANQIVSSGELYVRNSVDITGDVFAAQNMTIANNKHPRFYDDVVCYSNISDQNAGSKFYEDVYGVEVRVKTSGQASNRTDIGGKLYYVDYTNYSSSNKQRINANELPSMPTVPDFPDAPSMPAVKPFPGIPQVDPEDYQGKLGCKTLKKADLQSDLGWWFGWDFDDEFDWGPSGSGRKYLDLSTLDTEHYQVFYIDDEVSNLYVYGTYTGMITLVSKGKITVCGNVLAKDDDFENNGLMILSFRESGNNKDAINVMWNRKVDALLFAPKGRVKTYWRTWVRGGIMAKDVILGPECKVDNIKGIVDKFGTGTSGIESFEIMSWRETSGML